VRENSIQFVDKRADDWLRDCSMDFIKDSRKKKLLHLLHFFTCEISLSIQHMHNHHLRHTRTNRAYLNHFAKYIWHSTRHRYIRISLPCKARFLALRNYLVRKRERTIGTWRKRKLG